MSRTFVTTSRFATKLFGPTSCSAKISNLDLFLPKVRYVRKKFEPALVRNELRNKRRCVYAGPLKSAFACVSWWNKCIRIRTGIQVFAWTVIFFFLQKNLRVQNGVHNEVQNRVQIWGPKGGIHVLSTPQWSYIPWSSFSTTSEEFSEIFFSATFSCSSSHFTLSLEKYTQFLLCSSRLCFFLTFLG